MSSTITAPALAGTSPSTGAQAAHGTDAAAATQALLGRHLASFQRNDLDAVLADYSDESMLITADATYTGRAQIRGFFADLIPQFPTRGTRFDLDKLVVDGNVGFIVWHASTPTLNVPLGTDTFVLQDGKIHRQTFAGQLQPVAGRR